MTRRVTRRAGVFPLESNTKTIAKRARVELRTQVHMTVEMMFWMNIPSISRLGSPIIVFDNVLKIWIMPSKSSIDSGHFKS